MDLLWIIVLVMAVLLLSAVSLARKYKELYEKERSSKASIATKHGLTFEQLVPFTKNFTGNPRNFRFIGDPIDGILFGDDVITFVEFKTSGARLSARQNAIRALVEDKKVSWREIRTA